MIRQSRVWGTLLGMSLVCACHEAPDADTGPQPSVVTMFDLDRTLAADPNAPTLPLPGGIPFAGRFARVGADLVAKVIPAFAQGDVAAYITTEYWNQIPEVWVQPMYVLTTGRDATGNWVPTANLPIFSVAPVGRDGKTSAFYTPYWQVYYVTVPPTNTKIYRSVHEIFADKLPMEAGEPRLCSLVPMNATVENRHPITMTETGGVSMGKGFVDDVEFKVFGFGRNRFTYDPTTRVVDEQPLFIPVVRNKDGGGLLLAGLPAILGIRGLYQPATGALIGTNTPNFGSFWRVYLVLLPHGAGVQIPAKDNEFSYQVSALAASAANNTVVRNDQLRNGYTLRVLINPTTCIRPDGELGNDCRWLDSQDAIESNVPRGDILDTGITANCPFVIFKGTAVK